MASPNRIDILRILNSKGALTYSELKSLAGFKSKKESGKFAYHLRKLLRQSLVGLNKSERRYAITNLGKLVLSLARQIEEKSIIESGKMYVRTSNQTIEEFNSHKIIQCLVREANMSLEQSAKITDEVENKIYKSHVPYLTSSFIRNCVNSVLIEHGLEDQFNKLIRIGIPIYDLNKKLSNTDGLLFNGINDIITDISKTIFSDYFKTIFPKDILDMHFNGEVHLDDIGYWGMCPDTIFIDIESFMKKDAFNNNQFPYLPRISNMSDPSIILAFLTSIFQKQVSKEIVIENILKLFDNYSMEEISKNFTNSLLFSSFSVRTFDSPFITLVFPLKDNNDVLSSLLNGYLLYLDRVSIPTFGIYIVFSSLPSNEILDLVSKITKAGGQISLSRKSIRSSKGINKLNNNNSLPVISLHSLSLNLPHLAYQSNKDETYFRTKLALLMKPSLSALLSKRDLIFDNVRKGLLPTLTSYLDYPSSGTTNMLINLTGLNESIFNILGYTDKNEDFEIIQKVLKTANDVISQFDKTNHNFGISIINDNSFKRFMELDSKRFGKISHTIGSYSQGLVVTPRDLNENLLITNLSLIDDLLTGGFSVKLDVSNLNINDSIDFLSKSLDLIPYFEIVDKQLVCTICGSKMTSKDFCYRCNYANLITLT